MKRLITYLKTHINDDFNIIGYGIVLLFLTATIYLNYTHGFKIKILSSYKNDTFGLLYYFLFFAIPYYFILFILLIVNKKTHLLNNKELWVKSLLFLFLIGLGSHTTIYKYWNFMWESPEERYFVIKVIRNVIKGAIYIIPLMLIHKIYRDGKESFYGFSFSNADIKPYLIILMTITPIVIIASFNSGFQKTYPFLKPWLLNDVYGLTKWQFMSIYEASYSLRYVFVELIFRGALILSLAKVLEKEAVLPMVVVYAFLHFGKPLGETLGSVIGGYVIGVITLYSKNILGGCVIHIGIAYLMDFAAILQYYYSSK